MNAFQYVRVLRGAGQTFVETEVTTGSPLEMMKYSMHSYAAQFCEAAVHEATGEVRIRRWVGAFDTGRILNPKTATSQFRGGLAEYHIPVQADVPEIDIVFTDVPDPKTPLGAHGIGEIGITGVAAAVANAVYHATGKRVTDLPITLDKLL